ncbi:MAG: hypothetical protein KatS3mg105_4938 [Gemmatales bacterium]|nr:MAG: hypothetical protein KatS3mg105_4938 [Gemmatales bacterium]
MSGHPVGEIPIEAIQQAVPRKQMPGGQCPIRVICSSGKVVDANTPSRASLRRASG